MKHNWTYKKLGEVAAYINGFAFKPSDWKLQGLPIIRIQNLNDPSAEYNFYDKEIAPKYIVNDGDILISWSASLGVYEWQRGKAVLNQHIFKVVFDKSDIDKHYLKYCVEAKLTDMSRLAHGATMRHIVKGDFDNTPIPIPSLDEQQAIVRELDGINRLIDLQEEQLREYDRLAQSLFYTTFGDPTTNPKGWEVKKLGEVAETTSGGTPAKAHNEYYEGGTIPWLRSGEVSQGLIYKTELFITQAGLDNSSAKIIPVNSVAIAMYGATVGEVGIIKAPMSTNQAVCSIFPNESVTPIYLLYFLRAMKPHYINIAAGGAQPNISQAIIRNTKLTLPPLSLQQTFAAQIEAIEQQKALIRRSLEDTRTLLAARMQYYFE